MSKLSTGLAGLALLVLVGAGCAKSDAPKSPGAAPAKPAAQAPAAAPGKIAFDFPVQNSLNVSKGNYVLAPSKKAVTDGKTGTYIFYAAKMLAVGAGESQIETLAGSQETIPNSLIMRTGFDGAKAAVGDIVLTWWQSGSGMQRAIVTGGTATEPEVQYLDLDYSESAKSTVILPGSFQKLVGGASGSSLACKESGEWRHVQEVKELDGKILVVGWAGKVSVVPSADCLEVMWENEEIAVGDKVSVPVIGSYSAATVTKVDKKIGRVWAKYSFAGKESEEAFPIVDVMGKTAAASLK